MAASKKARTQPRSRRLSMTLHSSEARSWHIILANGADETVTAHDCTIYEGVLRFTSPPTHHPPDDLSSILIRAFGPQAWHDVGLVDLSHMRPAGLA